MTERIRVWIARHLRAVRPQAEARSPAKGEFPTPVPSPLAERSALHVLLADDHEINRQVAARILESLGVRASLAHNGRQAVEMLRQGAYDLVFLDCQMPLMNGPEVALEIRKGELPGRHMPIVALTGESSVECHDLCVGSGMDDVLYKPLRRQDIAAALERWLPEFAGPPGQGAGETVRLEIEAAPGAASSR